ncbi:hypothetical protein ZIOFF_056200 [Zingiber officinale]|uniref:Uncharacterized protein n=1 Tax=Zingiber officinale TaxID=94328 RepID=A0A8J5KSQ3_ZINOF|nr:hypothetical protein ZIOFF_056200 [Zingiber officinale]
MAHKTTAAMTSLNGGTAFHSLHVSRFATLLFRAHALLLHHFLYPSSVLLLAADLVLSFLWASAVPFRWCPVRRKEFPDSLLREVGRDDLPAIDVFVCTADPRREPPASVASTALSAMAFDYPTDRLSVYLSDDGGSAVTLFAFMEAARFARYWLPFCKENAVVKRSPEVYFEEECSDEAGSKNLKWLDWVIRPTQIYLHLQPMEVNSHTLMDGRILISFSNYTATRDNQPPYYNSHDEEIQSEGGEIITVLTEKHPGIDICLGYEEDYSEIPAATTDKEDYPYIMVHRLTNTATILEQKTYGEHTSFLLVPKGVDLSQSTRLLAGNGGCLTDDSWMMTMSSQSGGDTSVNILWKRPEVEKANRLSCWRWIDCEKGAERAQVQRCSHSAGAIRNLWR